MLVSCFLGGGGDATGLNVNIITVADAASLPSNADIGTIAVVTSTPIGAVTIGRYFPVGQSAGDLSIKIGGEKAVTLGYGASKSIVLPIRYARQFDSGGEWRNKTAYCRTDGAWIKLDNSLPIASTSYSGESEYTESGDEWARYIKTSGTLTCTADGDIDIFMIGGGAGGGSASGYGMGGGGGGYTLTFVKTLTSGSTYDIVIGAGGAGAAANGGAGANGGNTYAFGRTAGGGGGATSGNGGAPGGCGGGAAAGTVGSGLAGGSDGGDGTSASSTVLGGRGQGTTTRAFGEAAGTLYGGGGGGGATSGNGGAGGEGGGGAGASGSTYTITAYATAGTANTGGGGGGGYGYGSAIAAGAAGGSGIVIIRNAR